MKRGIFLIFLFSILFISSCTDLAPKKDIENILDTSLNLRSGSGGGGSNGCTNGVDDNGNGFIDGADAFCSSSRPNFSRLFNWVRTRDRNVEIEEDNDEGQGSRDYNNCELMFGDLSFSVIQNSGGTCRNSCQSGEVSVISEYGNLPPDYDYNDGNGVSNLDFCGNPSLKCCIDEESDADNIATINLCVYGEQNWYQGCTLSDLQYCDNSGNCYYGTRQLTAELWGCTDETACNYQIYATADDGSCYYDCGGGTPGCTYVNACNYDEAATIDDGSCYYADAGYDCDGNPTEVYGCTYSGACNYDPDATIDDGSCQNPPTNYDCYGNCIAGYDDCGVCGGSGPDVGEDCNGDPTHYDCQGVYGGEVDANGVESGCWMYYGGTWWITGCQQAGCPGGDTWVWSHQDELPGYSYTNAAGVGGGWCACGQ